MQPTAIVREAWELYKAHWRTFVPLALIVYLILGLVTLVLAWLLGWVGVLLGALVNIVGIFWLQGALVEAVRDVRDGRRDLSVGETFRRVQPRLTSIIPAGLIAGIAIAIGLILLIAPGLFLLTIWCLIVPAIVLEGKSAGESFGRSRELVRGNGWNVFGVIVLTILLLIGFAIVLGIVLTPLADWLQSFVSSVVSGTLTTPFIALVWTLLYFRLRQAKSSAVAEPPAATGA